MNLYNDYVTAVSEYRVPRRYNCIKLNQNESAFDYPDEIKAEILKKMKNVSWQRYPDPACSSLSEKIARKNGVAADQILVGNGSNELIQSLIASLPFKERCILLCKPGFSIYERVGKLFGSTIISVPLTEKFEFDTKQILDRSGDASLIVIVSPNNPTGTVISQEELEKILTSTTCPVLIDEAYAEFHGADHVELIKAYPRLIIARTFSKAFSSAGLRIGYLIGSSETIAILEKAKLPFSVGSFQQLAAEAILDNWELVENRVRNLIDLREEMWRTLDRMPGVEAIRSKGNFILFRLGELSSKTVFEKLLRSNILVRIFDSPELISWVRVTVGTPEENRKFLSAIKSIAEEVRNGNR